MRVGPEANPTSFIHQPFHYLPLSAHVDQNLKMFPSEGPAGWDPAKLCQVYINPRNLWVFWAEQALKSHCRLHQSIKKLKPHLKPFAICNPKLRRLSWWCYLLWIIMICICFAQGLVVTYEITFGSCRWRIYVHLWGGWTKASTRLFCQARKKNDI